MIEKIVLVTRKTRLEGLIERFNTRAQAKFYIEHSGGSFTFYEQEHSTYHTALAQLRQGLHRILKVHVIERAFLPNYLFTEEDLVVTIGIDGLVVNTAKYLTGQPLVAVNPDPAHIDGILLPFTVSSGLSIVPRVIREQVHCRDVTMAEARLNDGQTLLAFNDLFIGVKSHVSARYRIQTNGLAEHHSSSGIIVSTGAGSTGWLSSLFNMASGMVRHTTRDSSGNRDSLLAPLKLPWDTDHLVFVVREPFVSKTSGAGIVMGEITRESPLILESEMPEGGVIFSDGVEVDYLAFNAGSIAEIGVAAQKTRLVIGSA
ncbi:MAG: NAD+ kinase [Anaerolineae bacterium]|nr:NAD+ kinase [Anaerolineae bacterium]